MKKKIWNFAVVFISILSMFALIGWYAFEQVTNQVIIKGILDTVAKSNDIEVVIEKAQPKDSTKLKSNIQMRVAPKTIAEVLDSKPEVSSPDLQTVKKQVEERLKEAESAKKTSQSENTNQAETKGKKKVALTSEKIAEIERKIAVADRMAAFRIVSSSGGYNQAVAAFQAGDSDKAKEILSKSLSQAQKNELWGYYHKYEYLLYE